VGPVRAVQVLDPTGAGDAYRAGFAAGWLNKLPPEICAQLASTVAVYTVECYGTQTHTFSMDQFRDRYANAYGTKCPL
jgi:adenosine kinase